MVIASPNAKVNRFSSFSETLGNSGFLESHGTNANGAFRFDSSRCLNCSSNFTGQMIATSRQTATRITGTSIEGQEPHPEHPVGSKMENRDVPGHDQHRHRAAGGG